VRRWISILLLALIGVFYAAPLLHAASSDPESQLPACCRRNGKHHCAMKDRYLRMMASGAPAVMAPPQHCPMYPEHRGVVFPRAPFHVAVIPTAAADWAGLRKHPACHAQTEARYRIACDRSRLKRGPPASLLS
jgi:hypothetical protein